MIDRDHELSITRQAKLLEISRGTVYYLPRPVSPADLALMRRLDELHLEQRWSHQFRQSEGDSSVYLGGLSHVYAAAFISRSPKYAASGVRSWSEVCPRQAL